MAEPSSKEQRHETYTEDVTTYTQSCQEELVPHLHAATILVVLAVTLVSFTHVMALAVSGAYAKALTSVVGGSDKSSWLVAALTLPMVVISTPVCQAADFWGRRWLLIILTILGVVGCIITSRANSIGQAIAGQTFVGFSFGTVPLVYAIGSEVLPHSHRMSGQGALNIGNALGGVVGLLAGAGIIETYGPSGFRILWYINAATFAFSAVICYFYYRPPLREMQTSLTLQQKLHRLDWIGYGLLMSGLLLTCVGLSYADNPYPWTSVTVLAPLLIGLAVFTAFGIYEWKGTTSGMLDHRLFRINRNFPLAILDMLIEGIVFVNGNQYLPFQISVVYETRPILIGTNLSLTFITYMVGSFLAALYCYRYKKLRIVVVLANAAYLTFNVCMATTTTGSRTAVWVYPIFLGTGIALGVCGLVSIAQFGTPPDLISITSGLMSASRALGVTIGSTLGVAIFSLKLSKLLPSKIKAATISAGLPPLSLPALVQILTTGQEDKVSQIPGITPSITTAAVHAFRTAYVDSFRYVYILAVALSAVGLVISFFFIDSDKNFDQQIDAPAESEDALYGFGDNVSKEV